MWNCDSALGYGYLEAPIIRNIIENVNKLK